MIFPQCKHDKKHTPDGTGWILTCRPHFEAAVRLNLLDHLDASKSLLTETELKAARLEIHKLTSDLNDCLSAPGVAFIRCECGRMKLKAMYCKGCSK